MKHGRRGGISSFIHSTLPLKLRPDLARKSSEIE